ncbi:MAG: hypothetical protein ACLFVO_27405 [Chloroflexaceae bacterium]
MSNSTIRVRHAAPFMAILLVLLITMLPPATPPTIASDLPWRDKGTPFGVVAALGNRVRSDEIDEAVALMREAGVQWQREEIFWDKVQQVPNGPFDWDGDGSGFYDYDRAIEAQVSAGINVLGLLDYNPAWFKGKNPHPHEWIEDWGDYVYVTVARYGRERGWIKYWELWNEPNLEKSGYQSGLYEVWDFVRILEVGRAAALAADPEAKIVMGGLASIWSEPPSPYNYDYFDYLEAVAQNGGWDEVDIIAIHPYRPDAPEGNPWRRDWAVTFRDEMRRLDEILWTYGSKPIWLTEWGWSTNNQWPGVDLDTQAFFLVRGYVLALAHPSIEKIFWYDFRNDTQPGAPYERPVYDDREVEFHYGLLRRTYPLDPDRGDLRKPAFVAYRTLTQMLGGLGLQDVRADGYKPGQENVYWYAFAGSGRRVDVLWRTTHSSPDLQMNCNCRQAIVRGWNGQVKRILYTDDGELTFRLDATGAPMYIEYDPPVTEGGEYFAATGHSLRGAFRQYWYTNGGLSRFGYPLTEELIEPEFGSGRPRVVQYFERARFEHFPEFSGSSYEVQLGHLGTTALERKGVDWQTLPRVPGAPEECVYFAQTGHSLCPPFRAVWEEQGGLPLVGYPLTEAFETLNPTTNQPYVVQYFERARFERHPDLNGTPNEVQLGLLTRELLTSWGTMP